MSLSRLIKSARLYSIANLIFALINSLISIIVVKIFDLKQFGLLSYFNNIDNAFDYVGGHIRSTMEATVPGSFRENELINSFARIQLVVSLFSVLFFLIFSLFLCDKNWILMSQVFILLSPGKSYLGFFRIISKVTGVLRYYTLVILVVSLFNVILLINLFFGLDFYYYLFLRSIVLVVFAAILFVQYDLHKHLFISSFHLAYDNIRKKSFHILIYSFGSMLYLVLDKILIGKYFGMQQLALFSLSFMIYSFIQILIGSLMSAKHRILILGSKDDYINILNDSLVISLKILFILQIITIIIFLFPYFHVYKYMLNYLYFLFPAAFLINFLELGFIYLSGTGQLKKISLTFVVCSISYLILGLCFSAIFSNIIWFSFFL